MRKKGSRNKGYFYRKGRGWCATDKTTLTDTDGNHIRDKDVDPEIIKEAYARYLLQRTKPQLVKKGDHITVIEACQLYLDDCKATGSSTTYDMRGRILFGFCTGLPEGMWMKKPDKSKRIHKGYGTLHVDELIPLHVDQWLAAHPTWNGSRRTKIQAVKRALNYCVGAGVLTRNPLKGYKAGKANVRRTYVTPEQEQACYQHANPALAQAIKVCIRTGARYGCEFTKLSRRHVERTEQGMVWRFPPEESKTGKERIIRITDEEIIETVEAQLARYQNGAIFRNNHGGPWRDTYLSTSFTRLKKKLLKHGIELDEDACMYSTRHTYAKRALQGYWTGQPTNIERSRS